MRAHPHLRTCRLSAPRRYEVEVSASAELCRAAGRAFAIKHYLHGIVAVWLAGPFNAEDFGAPQRFARLSHAVSGLVIALPAVRCAS